MRFKRLKSKELKKAASAVKKRIDKHFKKDKWPLDYGFLVEEVFYEAYEEHLSNYLVDALSTKQGKYRLIATNKGLVIKLANK